ncbi:MAG: polysaccharide pyruvyl transferase family protein [Verrucomicrobia bacterium]|nr:polysaccharide pyruvyl transferase family protein [Verrucomicrobiota bacterium]
MNRRQFLTRSSTAAVATAAFGPTIFAAAKKAGRPPRVLLRSSWQSVNIGDIGHTPGALSLLYKHFPEVEVTLWPGSLGHGSRELLTKGYPQLKIVEGSLGKDDKPNNEKLAQVWAETDLYLSGSGSGFPASAHAVAFRRATGKPVGVFGVSTDPISGVGANRDPEGGTLVSIRERAMKLPPTHLAADLRYIMDNSAFFFCRDTISRDYLKAQGVKTPVLEFGPDAQLGMHLRDDAKGLAWLKERGLTEGKFICVIPRLRYTPYYKIRNTARGKDDFVKDAINERTTEKDHAKLREMIVSYIKATGHKVMVCAEMTYQVEMGKEVLVDPLPAEVKKNVVWRDTYWLPDEAASIYSKAQCVVSVECHSPLIALHQGTPTFYVRQPTDTCKGQMYRDFGAGDWFFEVDETNGPQLWSRLGAIVKDPAAAKARVKSIMATVEARQKRMVDAVREACRVG